MSDPLRPFLQLRALMLALVSMTAFCAGLLTPETCPVAAPHWLFLALVGLVITCALLETPLIETLDLLRPLRPVESSVVVYAMMALFFLYALFHEPTSHFPEIMLAMLLVHLALVPLSATDPGRSMLLLNSLFIVLAVGVAAPEGAVPWCLGYLLVTAIALVVHNHTQRLTRYALPRSVPTGPLLWHAVLTGATVVVLAGLTLPFFPDLRANLRLRIPTGTGGDVDVLEVLLLTVVLAGACILLIRLLRKLLITTHAPLRPVPEDEIEELFAEPESMSPVTRRVRLRLWRSLRERIVDEYCWLLARLALEGYPRPRFQTGEELQARVVEGEPGAADPLAALTQLFYRARYSDLPLDRADLARAHRLAREVLMRLDERA